MYFWPKIGHSSQNKNFPRHKTTKNDSGQLSQSSDQVVGNFDVPFEKRSKTLLFSRKIDKFWTKKGPKWAQKIIVRILIFIFHDETIIIAQQNMAMKHQKIDRKGPKAVKSTIL